MSFDSLAEVLESKHQLYLAAKRNRRVEILRDKFISQNIFSWL